MSEKYYLNEDGLYHRDIGMPECWPVNGRWVDLKYSNHAKRACIRDRYGVIPPLNRVQIFLDQLVEVEIREGKLVKLVARVRFNGVFDLILVLNPDGLVRTCWLNRVTDVHKTLDRSKYHTV